jgi:hypothetical protein
VVGLTQNDEVNSIFTREAHEAHEVPVTYVAIGRGATSLSPAVLARQGSRQLFDGPKDVERWSTRLRHDAARAETWRFASAAAPAAAASPDAFDDWLLLSVTRSGVTEPMHAAWKPQAGDLARVLLHQAERERAETALRVLGWEPAREVDAGDAAPAPQSNGS